MPLIVRSASILRRIVGVLLISSAISKVQDSVLFYQSVQAMHIPERVIVPVCLTVLLLEFGIGLQLSMRSKVAHYTYVMASTMFFAFATYHIVMPLVSDSSQCGCIPYLGSFITSHNSYVITNAFLVFVLALDMKTSHQ